VPRVEADTPGFTGYPEASQATDGTRWIFALYLLLIFWAPIPLGSNRPWSWAVLELWICALAIAGLVGHARGAFGYGPVLPRAWPVLACAVAWVLFVWLQLVPLPLGILQWVSPEAARWHSAAAWPDVPWAAPLTLDRHATLDSACKSTAYVAFLALALALLRDRERVRATTYVLIAAGVFQALYGAFYGYRIDMGLASGTFANRSHYAAYLVSCLSVGIGVLIASLAGGRSPSWGTFFRGMVEWLISPKMALRLLLVTLVIALVLSRSRMGNMSFFASLLVAGIVGLALSKRATRSMIVLLVSLVVIDVFIVGTYFGVERVVERIGQTTLQTEDRGANAGYAAAMWKDFPVFGSGLGSFPAVFPKYSGPGTYYAYTHAHNDYLEFAAETGIVGIVLLGLIVAMSVWAALRAQQLREDPVMRGVSFAALMGIVALMIHSVSDFSLQIPANALMCLQLLAFAWVSRYCTA
jgi:O-antigen ligase